MKFEIKNIHLGTMIREKAVERDVSIIRMCKFLNTTEDEINKMYEQESLDTEILLRWSKLLEYDFFRVYTKHLFISEPQNRQPGNVSTKQNSSLPQFRKTIYDKELIEFILELIDAGKKTKTEVREEYRIPKATLYQWIRKYKKFNC